MVLLAGDLFHENKPSRKSMYNVMRSLRQNCLGDKPCELEMLSDASEHFDSNFSHANYEDQDINVSIPVFSIHGNHDDPSGRGHFAALDLLQMAGLVNYYGRIPESDKISVKPVLLQKGNTKLALYGLSNVRDERLHRTFKRGDVKFFRPSQQKDNWFNLLSVHQNHHKYSETGWLPEDFLPNFMQLVVWGHEHECEIEPKKNYNRGFHVMQPGSSVATSLVPGEAVPKHVAILSITGKDFECETIPLRSVRPFITKEIVLASEPGMQALSRKENNRSLITQHLEKIVNGMIKEANNTWVQMQEGNAPEAGQKAPLPLIRLRVEHTAPKDGHFDIENPQRFSNRFMDRVANTTDVVYFHRRKTTVRKTKDNVIIPDEEDVAQQSLEGIRIDKLVREYLEAQSLTILPQNMFGDAVTNYILKDDKHAMESFVEDSLKDQIKNLLGNRTNYNDDDHDEELSELIAQHRKDTEDKFDKGELRNRQNVARANQKPPSWNSDADGHWEDSAEFRGDDADENMAAGAASPARSTTTARGRGRGRGRAAKATGTTRGRGRGKAAASSRADEDVEMLDDDDDVQITSSRSRTQPASTRSTSTRQAASKSSSAKQSTLNFASQSASSSARAGTRRPPARQLVSPAFPLAQILRSL